MNQEANALLESLLDSLLNDFNHWFKRGQELLAACPDSVLTPDDREAMGVRIDEGLKAIAPQEPWSVPPLRQWLSQWRR